MLRRAACMISIFGLFLAGCRAADDGPTPETSRLWGLEGELWTPYGRLPDFSFAGYRAGEEPLPDLEGRRTFDVRAEGAAGDGEMDDTDVFLRALADPAIEVIWIPPGRYRITRPLEIRRSHVALRGAGPDHSVLYMPNPLFETIGKGPSGGRHGYSWDGAYIWARGEEEEGEVLATISRPSRRGDPHLWVDDASALRPGQWIRLMQYEIDDGSLTSVLHDHRLDAFRGCCLVEKPGFRLIDWAVRIEAIEEGRVDIGRPLRVDVDPKWKAEIRPYLPSLQEIGIEGIAIEFPPFQYSRRMHYHELGFHGINFRSIFNGWIRNVRITNYDYALSLRASRYSTVQGIELRGRGGHIGLCLGAAQDSLITDFDIERPSLHDLTTQTLANGNVFSRGRGTNVNFDHHRLAAYENLFSDIEVGCSWRSSRIWLSSKGRSEHYVGARETYWNIRPRILTGGLPTWPSQIIIGPIQAFEEWVPGPFGRYLEPLEEPMPRDLHEAQRSLRLERRARGLPWPPRPGASSSSRDSRPALGSPR